MLGLCQKQRDSVMSALPPIADMRGAQAYVRFGPIAVSVASPCWPTCLSDKNLDDYGHANRSSIAQNSEL